MKNKVKYKYQLQKNMILNMHIYNDIRQKKANK